MSSCTGNIQISRLETSKYHAKKESICIVVSHIAPAGFTPFCDLLTDLPLPLFWRRLRLLCFLPFGKSLSTRCELELRPRLVSLSFGREFVCLSTGSERGTFEDILRKWGGSWMSRMIYICIYPLYIFVDALSWPPIVCLH